MVFFMVVVVKLLGAVVFVVILGVLALVVDFREVMMTGPPKLAQCALPHPTFQAAGLPGLQEVEGKILLEVCIDLVLSRNA